MRSSHIEQTRLSADWILSAGRSKLTPVLTALILAGVCDHARAAEADSSKGLAVEERERFISEVGVLRSSVAQRDAAVQVTTSRGDITDGLGAEGEPVVPGEDDQRQRAVPILELFGPLPD